MLPVHFLVVVRTGYRDVFRDLTETFRGFPATVIWDRRRGERRAVTRPVPVDRRRSQRRQIPRDTWQTLGFVIIETVGPPPTRRDADTADPSAAG